MKATSKAVSSRINALYALMATAAARRAISKIQTADDYGEAGNWAANAEEWLIRAGAAAAGYYYRHPEVTR